MRNAFFHTLLDLAKQDERIALIVGDLGFSVVEPFAEQLPKRFVNVGVAEQNMMGVAAGMALSGHIVFTYSIGNFPTIRCLEQVRNDVCYHNANVKIVAVGGGFAYGSLGFSHHVTEDLAVMRALPNMVVTAPGDPVETDYATRALAVHEGPAYLRLGRAGESVIHRPQIPFQLGKALTVREGTDLTLISTGGMLQSVLQVAERLAAQGVEARVVSMHTLKPLDADAVRNAAHETGAVITVEEHSEIGGLGSAVAEVLSESPRAAPHKRIAIPSTFATVAGSQDYLRTRYGLSVEGILEVVIKFLQDQRLSRQSFTAASASERSG